jgi:hypothetical protein
MTVEYEQLKTRWAVTRFELVLGWARAGVEPTAEDHLPSSAARTAARDRRKYTSSPGIESKVNSDHDESTVLDRISTLGVDIVEERRESPLRSTCPDLLVREFPPRDRAAAAAALPQSRQIGLGEARLSGPFLWLAA